jgi:hypothetical protein
MAVSLAFGVLMGTVITLFLVPCLYLILDDALKFSGRRKVSEAEMAPELAGETD